MVVLQLAVVLPAVVLPAVAQPAVGGAVVTLFVASFVVLLVSNC